MPNDSTEDKRDKIFATQDPCLNEAEVKPANVLLNHACLLPKSGVALDLACGLGGNAIFLAKKGLDAHAWDISQTAIECLQGYCEKNYISLTAKVRNIEQQPPTDNSYDVICVSYYLERDLTDRIIAALKPNGLLFYQTFIKEKVSKVGPSNAKYRLCSNELLELFLSLHILVYQEYGRVGNITEGLRDVAMLVAQKR